MAQKIFERKADVLDDLAKEHGGNISARMIRNGRAASVGVPILHMRTALPSENEAEGLQDAADLARLENGWPGHGLRSYGDTLCAHELGLQIWFTVLQKHFDDLPEIALKLVQRFTL